MNQIVFVVIDREEKKVLGVFNDEITAKQVAMSNTKFSYVGDEISITPVLVDSENNTDMSRKFWLTEAQIAEAVQDEMELVLSDGDDYENEDEETAYSDDEEDFSIDMDDYDYDDEDEEDESLRRVKSDFIYRYMMEGHSLDEACDMADALFN